MMSEEQELSELILDRMGDILYGLRNLYTGDEEQTRIEDFDRDELDPETLEILDNLESWERWEDAYAHQIKVWLRSIIAHWIKDFYRPSDPDEMHDPRLGLHDDPDDYFKILANILSGKDIYDGI